MNTLYLIKLFCLLDDATKHLSIQYKWYYSMIQAVSNDGFETKIALFIVAYATTFLNWQVKLSR